MSFHFPIQAGQANVEKADHLLQSIQKEIAALAAQCQAMSESTEKATTAQEERMVPGMGKPWENHGKMVV